MDGLWRISQRHILLKYHGRTDGSLSDMTEAGFGEMKGSSESNKADIDYGKKGLKLKGMVNVIVVQWEF